MLELKLPFFGKRGTIKSIKETKNVYEVSRYGISEKQIVPKKQKNLQGLINNYHEDTKKYLESNYNKYSSYKNIINERKRNGKYKGKIDINKIKAVLLTSTIGAGLSAITLLALLPSTSILVYLDMSILALSLATISASSNILANHLKDKKKDTFISKYNDYQKEVNEYNLNKNKIKNIPTKYRGINKENTKENTIHKTKKKINENLKNVA